MSKKRKTDNSDSSDEYDTDSEKHGARARAKKYSQMFRSEWLADKNLKSWLARDTKSQNAFCKWCNNTLQPKLSVLKGHMKGKKHQELQKSSEGCNKVSSLLKYIVVYKSWLIISVITYVPIYLDMLFQLWYTVSPNYNVTDTLGHPTIIRHLRRIRLWKYENSMLLICISLHNRY